VHRIVKSGTHYLYIRAVYTGSVYRDLVVGRPISTPLRFVGVFLSGAGHAGVGSRAKLPLIVRIKRAKDNRGKARTLRLSPGRGERLKDSLNMFGLIGKRRPYFVSSVPSQGRNVLAVCREKTTQIS